MFLLFFIFFAMIEGWETNYGGQRERMQLSYITLLLLYLAALPEPVPMSQLNPEEIL